MIQVDDDLMGGSGQERSPVFERHDYGEKFQVVDVVVSLCFIERGGVVSYGVLFTVLFTL